MFGEIGVPLSDSYELYLEFDEDELSCGYYIADHSKRCIFWLEPVSTEDVGMSPPFSQEHLRKSHLNHRPVDHRLSGRPPRARLRSGGDVLVPCRVLPFPHRDPHERCRRWFAEHARSRPGWCVYTKQFFDRRFLKPIQTP